MNREDFKKVTEEHIKTCREIVEKGDCGGLDCNYCPFLARNMINDSTDCAYDDRTVAKQFLELFEGDFKEKKMKKSDFKKVTEEIYNKVYESVNCDGYLRCIDCPLSGRNTEISIPSCDFFGAYCIDKRKQFLELFEKGFEPTENENLTAELDVKKNFTTEREELKNEILDLTKKVEEMELTNKVLINEIENLRKKTKEIIISFMDLL